MGLDINISVSFIKEGKRFIAYAPALDLSTSGKTFAEAKKRFSEIAALFFEEIAETGNAKQILESLGWVKQKKNWEPPVVISQNIQTISVPAVA